MKKIKLVISLFLCYSTFILYAQVVDPSYHYKFDGNLNEEIADAHGEYIDGNDSVNFIEGFDGTPDGAINFRGGTGQGYMVLLGTWSAVEEGTPGEITVAFWVKWYGSYADNTQDIINKRDNYQPEDMVWGINKPGPGTSDSMAVKRRGMSAQSFTSMDVNSWTHITISMDGAYAYFYKNGVYQEELEYIYGTGYGSRIHIGTAGNSDGSWREVDAFNGAIDDLRFYSYVLEEDEVLAVYQGGSSGIEDKPSANTIFTHNYPNPFTTGTTIKYSLSSNSRVEIAIYDLLGQQIATLVDEYRDAGTHEVTWDASGLPAGVYMYQLKTDDLQVVKNMLLAN
jgi:hypothetical protein